MSAAILPPDSHGNPTVALVDGNNDLFVYDLDKSDGSIIAH
ncbi:MAG TPA: hypothetical protein VHC69_14320 [Polyangiaceae bacterium]|nr:hypothetical protein [Polyangiaceae bacterium]